MLFRLPESPPHLFPDPELAEIEPNGLLAVGGDLSPLRLLSAYRQGIFPWFSEGEPILWWSPDPRMALFPSEVHVSRSMRKLMRQGRFRLTKDRCFRQVMEACAAPRQYASSTWINPQMIYAYCALHELGHAHSFEVWQGDELVGGLYGVAIGSAFFGESMFSRADNASKAAFICMAETLGAAGFQIIDCQLYTDHLASLGAQPLARHDYLALIHQATRQTAQASPW